MSRPPPKTTPVVVKRPPEQRRKLPPELEAFARSDEERLRIRRPRVDKGLVRDPREGYTIAGVANRDARAVYDVRTEEMRSLWQGGEADEAALHRLGQMFHDALRLELWRARRLTGFAAFAEEVIGVPAGRAEALAEAAALRTGESVTPLTERSVALWLRTEAGLFEGDESARARIRTTERGSVLELSVSLADASTALAGAGARHLPLARSPGGGRDEAPSPRAAASEPEVADEVADDERVEGVERVERDEAAQEEAAAAPALDEDGERTDEEGVASKPVASEGGVRLLTRKPHERRGPAGDAGERWERPHARESGGFRGGREERGGGREQGGGRPRFETRAGEERGRFGARAERGGRDDRAGRFEPRGGERGGRFEPRGGERGGQRAGREDRGGRLEPRGGGERGGRERGGREERGRFEPRGDRGGQRADDRGRFDRAGERGARGDRGGGGARFGARPQGGARFGQGAGAKAGGHAGKGGAGKHGGGKGFGARKPFAGQARDAGGEAAGRRQAPKRRDDDDFE